MVTWLPALTVGTSATALNTAGTAGTTLTIKNGAAAIDLGGSGVTNGGGLSVAASASVGPLSVDPGDVLFAICATSSVVEVLRT